MDNADIMLELNHVTKQYGRVTAVKDLSFQVRRGEICGFLGPNGAGKTTTLRMLLGLTHPTSGTIKIQGTDVVGDTPGALQSVGAIIEESHFYRYLTGEQNLRQVLRLRGLEINAQALRERLNAVGLGDAARRRVKGYSLGMRQRLALALAMLQEPAILILDEPMNGLDPAAMRDFRLHLVNLSKAGVTILLSSHILTEVEQLATTFVFINHGQLVGSEGPDSSQQIQTLMRGRDAARLGDWLASQHQDFEPVEDGAYRVRLEDPDDVSELIRDAVNAGLDLVEIRPYATNLEHQYLERMALDQGGLS